MNTQSDINKKRQFNTNIGENVDQEQSPPQQKNLNDMDGTYHNYPLVKKEDISRLAYHLWESSGRPLDDGMGFWLEAEKKLGGPHTEQKD